MSSSWWREIHVQLLSDFLVGQWLTMLHSLENLYGGEIVLSNSSGLNTNGNLITFCPRSEILSNFLDDSDLFSLVKK